MAENNPSSGGGFSIFPWLNPEQEEALRRWKEDPAHKQGQGQQQPEQNTENRNE